ncbi:MAG: hypothetical protein QM767_23350 [Anaeromyxobacter sp.]
MLDQCRITTILPVVDVQRARQFYEKRLGLTPGRPRPDGGVRYSAGGTALELSPRQEPTQAQYTAATFEVRDVEREVQDLESRGVRFEDYDLPGLKTVGHICVLGSEKAAWFKDTEGNTLCIHEESGTVQ